MTLEQAKGCNMHGHASIRDCLRASHMDSDIGHFAEIQREAFQERCKSILSSQFLITTSVEINPTISRYPCFGSWLKQVELRTAASVSSPGFGYLD